MRLKYAGWIVFLVLLIDQISKIYIKTHFIEYESVKVFDWFRISFIENEGAAWGMQIPGQYGKIILTLFRIVAVCAISYWLIDTAKKKISSGLLLSLSLILAGALGNIVDSVFYGVIFDHSTGQVATLFAENPYGSVFYGKVVDMLHFPLIDTQLPQWIPFFGGERFTFFDPIFNIADVSISIGAGVLFLTWAKDTFKQKQK